MRSVAHKFWALLTAEDAVKELDGRVKAYAKQVEDELASGWEFRRQTELKRLYQIPIDRAERFAPTRSSNTWMKLAGRCYSPSARRMTASEDGYQADRPAAKD